MVLKGSVNFGPRGSTALGFGGHAHRAFPQGKAVRKSSDIKVAPEHWLDGKGGLNKYVKGGRDGHPKAELLNNKLRKFKET